MGRRKVIHDAVKVTLKLHEYSYKRLKELYPHSGAEPVIRALVKQHVDRMDRELSERAKLTVELDLEETDV